MISLPSVVVTVLALISPLLTLRFWIKDGILKQRFGLKAHLSFQDLYPTVSFPERQSFLFWQLVFLCLSLLAMLTAISVPEMTAMGFPLGKSNKSTMLRFWQTLCRYLSVNWFSLFNYTRIFLTLPNNQNILLAFNVGFLLLLCFLCFYLPTLNTSLGTKRWPEQTGGGPLFPFTRAQWI